MENDFETLVELCERAVERHKNNELFGTKLPGGAWRWTRYGDFKQQVDEFRGGLKSLGVSPGDKVGIVSNNRVEWAVAAFATYGLGGIFVPMYEAQPVDEWKFILNDCGAKVVIGSSPEITKKLRDIQAELPNLEHVVGLENEGTDELSYQSLLKIGRENPAPLHSPKPEDVAGLIYTSGTTGKPKGVILTHRNFCSNILASAQRFELGESDRSLAFLPWAHSFGQTCELYMNLSRGASMAINDEISNLVANLGEIKPTILVAVPRIFNRIYDGVNRQMADKPAPIRALFHAGIRNANRKSKTGELSALSSVTLKLADKLIFSKVRQRFGGRLRYVVSGSAALSPEVAEFIDALGIDVYEGYGLTETSPVATTNYAGFRKIGSVGPALPGVRIEIDTKVTNDPKHGEIVIYGPNVMQGYYNRPEETAQVLTPDGGLRTGDMGYLDEDGYLYITGRIKEQYKLENGKYVVPAPLEEALKLSPYIANVMIHGANRPHNVALIVPDVENLKRWASERGKSLSDLESDAEVRDLIQAELDKYSANFKSFERPKAFVLVSEDFTTENEMLTPTLKVKRRNVFARYGERLESLY